MLDLPWDMKAYLLVYFLQMAGMQKTYVQCTDTLKTHPNCTQHCIISPPFIGISISLYFHAGRPTPVPTTS